MRNKYVFAVVCGLILAGCNEESSDESLCGTVHCSETQVCENEHCVNVSCHEPETLCPDKRCYDLNSDDEHCGKCDVSCGNFESCQSGTCKVDENKCVLPNLICHGECINPMTEHDHCGNCETKCNDDQVCDGGRCIYQCELPKTACSDGCFDLENNTKNCKTCGHDCNAGRSSDEVQLVCVNGECVDDCPERQIVCGGNCTDPKKDRNFCGATGNCDEEHNGDVCADGADCINGKCVCGEEGETVCKYGDGFRCANPKSEMSCGCSDTDEGLICRDLNGTIESVCTDEGKCDFTCDENRVDCNEIASDGCEADLTMPEYCGSCGHACNTTNATSVACEEGRCIPTCTSESTLCGEECVLLNENNDNCGECGNKCLGNSTCQNGFCVVDVSECKCVDDVSECEMSYVDDVAVLDANDIETHVKAYCIKSENDLIKVRDHIRATDTPYPDLNENPDNAYILMANIRFGEEENWVPIGADTNGAGAVFEYGYFLGNGKRITGGLVNSGLFGIVQNGSVIDGLDLELNVKYLKNNEKQPYCGVLAAAVYNDVAIRHIKSTNSVVQCFATPCGGLVGLTEGGTSVFSMIDIQGRVETNKESNADDAESYHSNIGGLLGAGSPKLIEYVDVNVDIVNKVTSPMNQGLLIGHLDDENDSQTEIGSEGVTLITDSHVKGKIYFKEGVVFNENSQWSNNIGGMIGRVNRKNHGLTINRCTAEVENSMISALSGGLIGGMESGLNRVNGMTILNSKTSGHMDCWRACGGFIGKVNRKDGSEFADKILMLSENDSSVDVKVNSGYYYHGGFIGDAEYIQVENCQAVGEVETNGSVVGGFAGVATNSSFDSCRSGGDVTGISNVGGFIGYSNSSTFQHIVSLGMVSGDTSVIGGMIGSSSSDIISHSFSSGNVEGNSMVGSFIGVMSNGSVDNSMSMGNVVGKKDNSHDIGFIGHVAGIRGLFNHLAGYGDLTGDSAIGGLMGVASDGVYTISNVVVGGKITGDTNSGYLIGRISEAPNYTDIDLQMAYYLKNGEEGSVIGSDMYPSSHSFDISKAYPFTFNESHEPVLENGTKVVDRLSNDVWVELACELKSSIGEDNPGKYMIPVLKSLGLDICE